MCLWQSGPEEQTEIRDYFFFFSSYTWIMQCTPVHLTDHNNKKKKLKYPYSPKYQEILNEKYTRIWVEKIPLCSHTLLSTAVRAQLRDNGMLPHF